MHILIIKLYIYLNNASMIMWQDIKPDIGGNGCKMQSMPILTTNTK